MNGPLDVTSVGAQKKACARCDPDHELTARPESGSKKNALKRLIARFWHHLSNIYF
jgi:hypothetical protein